MPKKRVSEKRIEAIKADLLRQWRAGEISKETAYARYALAVSWTEPTREDKLDVLLGGRPSLRPTRVAGRANAERIVGTLLSPDQDLVRGLSSE